MQPFGQPQSTVLRFFHLTEFHNSGENVPCINPILKELKRAKLNDVVWFWASGQTMYPGTFSAHATVRTSKNGISQLTWEGERVKYRNHFSGVFPNRFSDLENITLRIGTIMVSGG